MFLSLLLTSPQLNIQKADFHFPFRSSPTHSSANRIQQSIYTLNFVHRSVSFSYATKFNQFNYSQWPPLWQCKIASTPETKYFSVPDRITCRFMAESSRIARYNSSSTERLLESIGIYLGPPTIVHDNEP